jgi:ACS family hexuronate transporter-like MFS transporter
MPTLLPNPRLSPRPAWWKWWVCGLLLLATMVNYMDRLTLNLMAPLILNAFRLGPREYGFLESAFGTAFALGAIVMGWLADRWNVRWIYPLAVLAWSLAGFLTGLAFDFTTLLLCRFLLGLAEAGNWPCALRTTQRVLAPAERAMGNSILQSGAAFGALLTPVIVVVLIRLTGVAPVTTDHTFLGGFFLQDHLFGVAAFSSYSLTPVGSWRLPFMVVGVIGGLWVVLWLVSVRREDLALRQTTAAPSLISILFWLLLLLSIDLLAHLYGRGIPGLPLLVKAGVTALGIGGVFWWLWNVTREDAGLSRRVFFARFWVLATIVVMINITWHFFRAWLPLFLQRQHHYGFEQTSWFILAYYLCTDAGSLSAGFAALMLSRSGLAVHWSRVTVFACCAALTALSVWASVLPAGPLLLGLLLVIGFAALGLFPAYYSFSQELTVQHQGKLTGSLGCICWLVMALLHEVVGESVEATRSYSQGVALAGLAPLVGLAAMLLFWGRAPGAGEEPPVVPPAPEERAPVPLASREGIQKAERGVAQATGV